MIDHYENEIQSVLEELSDKIYSCYRLGKTGKGELTNYSINSLREIQEIHGKILNELQHDRLF